MYEFKKYIGMSIKNIRLSKGYSQKQLAYFSGLTIDIVKNIEKGKSVSLDKLDLLSDELDVKASYVLYVAEQMRADEFAAAKKSTSVH